ncbi:hypothetical protein XalbCFBP2523_01505 [Xanthomonas albilineans]|nr:hypothetical protein XalbCFBP2523_01505 [Xanthomonas albilineans]
MKARTHVDCFNKFLDQLRSLINMRGVLRIADRRYIQHMQRIKKITQISPRRTIGRRIIQQIVQLFDCLDTLDATVLGDQQIRECYHCLLDFLQRCIRHSGLFCS